MTTRIVGGSPASSNEFPYFIRWGGCGATLIHNDIALGAAHVSHPHWRSSNSVAMEPTAHPFIFSGKFNHCFKFFFPQAYGLMSDLCNSSGGDIAYVGTTQRSGSGDESVATTVERRVSHPNFVRATYENDYSVMKLSGWVRSVALASEVSHHTLG